MLMGHYGVSLAANPAQKSLPLWLCFLAVQWLDFWWASLVIAGVEKFRIGPGGLEFYYMPCSHSLPGALVLSVLLGLIAAAFWAPHWRTFLVVAALAFSHWFADLLVHLPDLPLYGDSFKVGFSLWKYPMVGVPLELSMLWAGAIVYATWFKAASAWRALWLWVFVGLLSFEHMNVSFGWVGPFFTEPRAIAALSLSIWLIAMLLAGLVGLTRKPTRRPAGRASCHADVTKTRDKNIHMALMRQGGPK